nr:uncharacterized protein LOC112544374 [Pelodiscus sinensis]|eukprot:XP_025036245.1 uncharacterized protein LOC112544374 [Pelodiscus sinensis]
METLVPGRLPRSTLWMVTLLLCLGTGTLGDLNLKALDTIMKHITAYGVNNQYSFAVSLPLRVCRNASGLGKALPDKELQDMKNIMGKREALYVQDKGHIVASRPKFGKKGTETQHSEWRLLNGDQNNPRPVQKLLAETYRNHSCLIFFTLNSPCLGICLNESSPYYILPMVRTTFSLAKKGYRAFVFQQIFHSDEGKGQQLLNKWKTLQRIAPLIRCDNNGCQKYNGDGTSNQHNLCLEGRPVVRRRLHPPRRGAVGQAGGTLRA